MTQKCIRKKHANAALDNGLPPQPQQPTI